MGNSIFFMYVVQTAIVYIVVNSVKHKTHVTLSGWLRLLECGVITILVLSLGIL